MNKAKLETLGMEYQLLKQTINEAEIRQDEIKDELRSLLPLYDDALSPADQCWQAGPTKFQWVKGRTTNTVDNKKLRLLLIQAGVSVSVLDDVFEKATTSKTSSPSLRIVEADPNEEE